MAWLVSIKWNSVFRYWGRVQKMGPNENVFVMDEHPAKYAAECAHQFHALQRRAAESAAGEDRADEILAIHSAIEIPDDLLTADDIDVLS